MSSDMEDIPRVNAVTAYLTSEGEEEESIPSGPFRRDVCYILGDIREPTEMDESSVFMPDISDESPISTISKCGTRSAVSGESGSNLKQVESSPLEQGLNPAAEPPDYGVSQEEGERK